MRKLTPELVEEIRRRAKDTGLSSTRFAAQFDISVGMLLNILKGRSWKSVTSSAGVNAAQVRALRQALGLNQGQMARQLDLDRASWCSWESGNRPVGLESARKIQLLARLNGLDLDAVRVEPAEGDSDMATPGREMAMSQLSAIKLFKPLSWRILSAILLGRLDRKRAQKFPDQEFQKMSWRISVTLEAQPAKASEPIQETIEDHWTMQTENL